ncbi:MAG TPA: universal stress protein [Deltaproteobacteria bacterium]|nr:universal stress protein [Deltaproteobacteria bacterium]
MDAKPLLVAVDFSQLTPRTIRYAVRLAQGQGALVDLLHVMLGSLPAHAQANAPAEVLAKIRQGEEISALRALQGLMQTEVPEACRGRILLRRGPPADTICTVATEAYEMVVVSTHGRTGLSQILIGSVAERVVRHAPIPVLVVRGAGDPGDPIPD